MNAGPIGTTGSVHYRQDGPSLGHSFIVCIPCVPRWICVYPAYLNARKTLSEGRRVGKTRAVDNPLCTEIRDVCASQNLEVELESNKHYPRESARDQIHSGRVRVQLRNEDGTPLNPSIGSREYSVGHPSSRTLGH